MLRRAGQPDEERGEGPDARAGWTVESSWKDPARRARSIIYRCRFPPQEHKIGIGDSPHDPETGAAAGTVVDLDDDNGVIDLKLGTSRPAPREGLEFLKLGEERAVMMLFETDPFSGGSPIKHEFQNIRSVAAPRATNSRVFRILGMGSFDEAIVFFRVIVTEERFKRGEA